MALCSFPVRTRSISSSQRAGSTGAREPPVFFARKGSGKPLTPRSLSASVGIKDLDSSLFRARSGVRVHVLPAPWHVNSTISLRIEVARRRCIVSNVNVTQRITRMPRLSIPMKDVASCDKLRSAARQALPAEDLRMGKPLILNRI